MKTSLILTAIFIMIFSFFTFHHAKPDRVIFLDFDDTIAQPARDADGEYIVEADGHIDAVLLDKAKFSHFVQTAIKHDVPLYIVTGRPDIKRGVTLINDMINSVNGFSNSVGGFHHDSIIFLSKMVKENGKLVRKEMDTKVNIIDKIHREKYSYLPNENILFIDDMQRYYQPVQALGYQVIKADAKTLAHFAEAEDFITHTIQHHYLRRNIFSIRESGINQITATKI